MLFSVGSEVILIRPDSFYGGRCQRGIYEYLYRLPDRRWLLQMLNMMDPIAPTVQVIPEEEAIDWLVKAHRRPTTPSRPRRSESSGGVLPPRNPSPHAFASGRAGFLNRLRNLPPPCRRRHPPRLSTPAPARRAGRTAPKSLPAESAPPIPGRPAQNPGNAFCSERLPTKAPSNESRRGMGTADGAQEALFSVIYV
jgi:hypothetical protein